MITLLIAILIVYGFVLIAVRGTIFSTHRTAFFVFVNKCEKWFKPEKYEIVELLATDSYEIDNNFKELHQKIVLSINNSNNDELLKLLDDLILKITTHVENKRKTRKLKRISLFILKTIEKLWQCPMCLGFWIGVIICILTLLLNISILGSSLTIITCSGLPAIVSIFLMACLFSGTTWAIDQIVEYYSENIHK
jgi:hypothetical protein